MECTFVGNISKDAELRTVKIGDQDVSVCTIWVGENLGRSNSPETEQKTAWRKVTLWRQYASKMAEHLKKGRRIEVRNGFAGEAQFYNRGNQIVPYVPVTIGRGGTIYFMDSKREDNLPPETVLNEQPTETVVAISEEDMPF